MSEVTETLTAKVGGVPTWVYGLGAGGLVLVLLKLRDKRKAPPATADTATPEQATPAPGTFSYEPDEFAMSPSPMGGGSWAVAPRTATDSALSDDTDAADGQIETNGQWAQIASDWLIGIGYPPLAVNNAIGSYLNGELLTAEEGAIVVAALKQFKTPPDGAPNVRVQPAPVTSQPPATTPTQPVTPSTAPAPWSPPIWLKTPNSPAGLTFVKADQGSTATYVVHPTGIEWIPSYDTYYKLGKFTSEAQANSAPFIVPAATLKPIPRIGQLPSPEYDASLR